ncbi:DUF1931 family protein [Hydrogenimonas sp.]
MRVEGAYKIERLFKKTAGLDLPKARVAEVEEAVDRKLHDLLLVAQESAGYNGRDTIWLSDVPLTKAMRESMRYFAELEVLLDLKPLLERLAHQPPLKYGLELELERKLPEIAGTLIYILAKVTGEISSGGVVSHDEIKRALRILDLTI